MALKHFKIETDPKMQGLNIQLLTMLDNARTMADMPFIITSGVRTMEENRKVGGVNSSAHLLGLACDIKCENDTQAFLIIKGAVVAGFKRIGIGKGHIHLDIDSDKPQNVLFIEN
jgi:hypothetical protein